MVISTTFAAQISPTTSPHIFVDPQLAENTFSGVETLTHGQVLEKLAEHCKPFRKQLANGKRVEKVVAEELSATNGFTSRVYRCSITFASSQHILENGNGPEAGHEPKSGQEDQQQPLVVLVKVFAFDRIDDLMAKFVGEEKLAEMIREIELKQQKSQEDQQQNGGGSEPVSHKDFFALMHRNECNFYEFIGPEHQKPLPLPKVYYTQLGSFGKEQGLILMEFLDQTHLASFADGLNEQQVEDVVRHLARLHGHLLLPEANDQWKQMFMTSELLFRGGDKGGGGDDESGKFIQAMIERLDDAQRKEFLGPLHRLSKVTASMEFGVWAHKKCQEELGIKETLVHGDLWVNNLLWSNQEPDKVAAFIDWQLSVRGNPMTDIARLLLMSVESEHRHRLEKDGRVFAVYLEALNEKLCQNGAKPVGYGVEELQHAYNLAAVGQSLCCVFVVPFFQSAWANDPEKQLKLDRIFRRAIAAMKDAMKAMETEAPEWLGPSAEEEGKTD